MFSDRAKNERTASQSKSQRAKIIKKLRTARIGEKFHFEKSRQCRADDDSQSDSDAIEWVKTCLNFFHVKHDFCTQCFYGNTK